MIMKMTKSKMSRPVPLNVVAFLCAFCRKDLSDSEVEVVVSIFEAFHNGDEARLNALLANASKTVSLAKLTDYDTKVNETERFANRFDQATHDSDGVLLPPSHD